MTDHEKHQYELGVEYGVRDANDDLEAQGRSEVLVSNQLEEAMSEVAQAHYSAHRGFRAFALGYARGYREVVR